MLIDNTLLLYISLGALMLLFGWAIRLEIKLRRLSAGKKGLSLEGTIHSIAAGQKELESFRREIENYLHLVEKRLCRSIQVIEVLRFNPFKGSGEGGNQSFSAALLSENGDGVVLSSLHSRDRTSVYSKPLKAFKSGHSLSEEEKGVVEGARKELLSRDS